MELTPCFLVWLQDFRCVFTAPTFRLFGHLVAGWALSCRHRFITECIFSSGNVGNGHWSRYHRFFSHAAWCLDHLCQVLARLLVKHLVPTGPIVLAGDDTLCRKRGLTLYGAGMHHDPLISSRALKLVSWGHDWVVLCLLLRLPAWAPTKVFALAIGFRLYKNRQGLTKGQKKAASQQGQKQNKRPADPNHRTRPELGSGPSASDWRPSDPSWSSSASSIEKRRACRGRRRGGMRRGGGFQTIYCSLIDLEAPSTARRRCHVRNKRPHDARPRCPPGAGWTARPWTTAGRR
jgi:hypothetical protein